MDILKARTQRLIQSPCVLLSLSLFPNVLFIPCFSSSSSPCSPHWHVQDIVPFKEHHTTSTLKIASRLSSVRRVKVRRTTVRRVGVRKKLETMRRVGLRRRRVNLMHLQNELGVSNMRIGSLLAAFHFTL